MNTKEQLEKELISGGYLKTPRLIEAFKSIDRKEFVSEESKEEAYENRPLAIGHNQTISQPLTVAFMLELLDPQEGEKILDIGAGSGWQTTLLAYAVMSSDQGASGKIIAIERIPELAKIAETNTAKFGLIEKGLVHVIEGDGTKGYEPGSPFDKIIAAASGEEIPEPWKTQLKIGGRLVVPVKESIIVLDKISRTEFERKEFFGFRFVPLISD